MNGPGHYARAQEMLTAVGDEECGSAKEQHLLAAAQVHATLALAAAAALCHPDERGYIAADLYRDWHKAAAS